MDSNILEQKRISKVGGKAAKEIRRLVSMIIGEDEKKGFRFFSRK